MTEVYRDPERFFKTYLSQFPGCYETGDGAQRDEKGLYWILGRMDDVIKVSGHRLGTAEIESALITHSAVVESGAVGVPDAITGESLHVFVVLKEAASPSEALASELIQVVRQEVGALATPKKLYWVPGLPKTRSGKIMRRILRKIATGEVEHLGDLNALSDPGVIDQLIQAVRASNAKP
jgi:acetyl-CoA synthetase